MTRTISQQDISWFLDLNSKDQLDLNPPYQRRSVWTLKDKRFFIDTILSNYPAPPIFLHKSLDDYGRATYHVVDGKQRLQTIIDFAGDKIRIPDDFADVNLQKNRWSDLSRETRETFWNYVLIVEMLPSVDDAFIRDTFERINRNSRKLERQEIRHAKYEGWLISTASAEADKDEWKDFGIVTTARVKRMLDVQFISELFAIILKQRLNGFDQDYLDELYAEYEDPEEVSLFVEEDFKKSFENTKNIVRELTKRHPNITNYTKLFTHFYSLWSFLALQTNEQLDLNSLAEAYIDFMEKVTAEIKVANSDGKPAETDETVRVYAVNSRGASTDLAPRKARHEQLTRAFVNVPGVVYEDS